MKSSAHIFILLLAVLVAASGFISVNLPPAEKLEVYFTPDLQSQDLRQIQATLKEKGILLSYEAEFNGQGYLQWISFEVDFQDGFKGKATSRIPKLGKLGFVRDFTPGCSNPLEVGRFFNLGKR
jgi:hypothetical protein